MSDINQRTAPDRKDRRRRQEEQLRASEAELRGLASEGNKEEFFKQITQLLGPLKDYIKRQLRIAYLNLQLRREGVYNSDDILDETILAAYQDFDKKPKDLSLEQWLYQVANEKLESYLKRTSAQEKGRRSLESLAEKEESTLEERMTTDAEGEVMLDEDLYDTEYHLQPEFTPPTYQDDPSEVVEREEEIREIVRALSRVPERERMVFELYVIEGFSKEEVAGIARLPADEVPHIVEKVRSEVLKQVTTTLSSTDAANKRAS
jgi:RNA polymerase sigma factor (sigma-70 family)